MPSGTTLTGNWPNSTTSEPSRIELEGRRHDSRFSRSKGESSKRPAVAAVKPTHAEEPHGGAALRHYTYYRPTILVLLKEHESHGYELISRMNELGFDHRLASSLYGVLRDMEDEGLIVSSWDLSGSGGPPRHVYALTASGEQFLRDSMPTLVRRATHSKPPSTCIRCCNESPRRRKPPAGRHENFGGP